LRLIRTIYAVALAQLLSVLILTVA